MDILFDGKVEIWGEGMLGESGPFRMIQRNERHRKFDGTWSKPKASVVFERPNSVAVLIHDLSTDRVVLLEQFRQAICKNYVYKNLFEIPAGTIGAGESAEDCARREVLEEVGVAVKTVQKIHEFFPSPGANSEKITIFYAPVNSGELVAKGGGLPEEGEDILVHWITREEVASMLADMQISDGKTIVAFEWFLRQK